MTDGYSSSTIVYTPGLANTVGYCQTIGATPLQAWTSNAPAPKATTKYLYEVFIIDKHSHEIDGPYYVVASNTEEAKFETGAYEMVKANDYSLADVNIVAVSKGAVEVFE